MEIASGEVTRLLHDLREGRQESAPELFSLIYQDLHSLAASYMRKERPDHTLQATALVNEAYLRMFQGQEFQWENRKHFFCTMAQMMRHILVDHARRHTAGKRGGPEKKLSLDEALVAAQDRPIEILALHTALEELERRSPRQAQVVELRFIVGLTVEETAAILDVSEETVKLDWRFAKAWLHKQTGGV